MDKVDYLDNWRWEILQKNGLWPHGRIQH
jgi:hypothetical protein